MAIKNDWLKGIIGEAFTEDMDTKVSDALGQRFVSKSDFNLRLEELNSAKTQLGERDNQLKELQKVKPEELQAQIATLTTANATAAQQHAEQIKQLKLGYAIDAQLLKAGAVNTTAVKALLKTDKIALDGENVVGLQEQIDALKESEKWAFMPSSGQSGQPMRTHMAGGGSPKAGDRLEKADENSTSQFMNSLIRGRVQGDES